MRHFAILSLAMRPVRRVVGVLLADDYPATGGAAQSPTFTHLRWDTGSFTKAWFLAACATLLSVAFGVGRAAAQTQYRFVNIADSSGPLRTFSWEYSINNWGAVAFVASEDSSIAQQGVYVGNGGPISTIAHTNGPYSSFSIYGGPDINDRGTVAFTGSLDAGGPGVFASDGVTSTTIALSGGATPFRALGKPALNQSGEVAFWASKVGTGWGVYVGNGGEVALAANGQPTSLGFSPSISIGDDGFASFVDGGSRILKVDGDAVSTIVEVGANMDVYLGSRPIHRIYSHSTSSSGTTAFIADVDTETGVFTVRDGVLMTVTHHYGPLRENVQTDSVAINDAGTVAFVASRGIFTGDDPVTDKVIRTGEALFGSTLLRAQHYVDINNRGDIAFRYTLTNGVEGIAVARVVPEPASVLMGEIVVAALLARRIIAR